MATEAEIESLRIALAKREIFINKDIAQEGLEAAERVRAEHLRATCKHPRKTGNAQIGMDGSGKSDWYCPDCGMVDQSSWPASGGTVNDYGVIPAVSGDYKEGVAFYDMGYVTVTVLGQPIGPSRGGGCNGHGKMV